MYKVSSIYFLYRSISFAQVAIDHSHSQQPAHTAQKLAITLLQRCNILYCSAMLQRHCKEFFFAITSTMLQQSFKNIVKK